MSELLDQAETHATDDRTSDSDINDINDISNINSEEIGNIESDEEVRRYKDSTYEIISKVAYLIGVPKHIFENEKHSPKIEIYEELEGDRNARIIRHLCVIRNSIERSFKNINNKMRYEYRSLLSLTEHIPEESIRTLSGEGIIFYKSSNTQLYQHIIEINKLISDRINNCKSIFPLWLNWEYLKQIFIMPNGTTEAGTKAAANLFYTNLNLYPYKMYINWIPKENGNILYNDKKFVTLLYEWNGNVFTDFNKVSDAGSYIKGSIYDYIEESRKIVIIVDCENSDPYKLCAVIRNLDYTYTSKISSIILLNDIHAASAWVLLEQFTSIPIEHIMTERVMENKSLVDVMLTARVCKEHFANEVDSFIIASSDSDYWGLIQSLPEARFLLMIERDSSSIDLKNALSGAGIFYCYIDDFYSGNTDDVKHSALIQAMRNYVESKVDLNIYDMFENALKVTRVEMTTAEKNQFIAKYIRNMQLRIESDGRVVFEFKR